MPSSVTTKKPVIATPFNYKSPRVAILCYPQKFCQDRDVRLLCNALTGHVYTELTLGFYKSCSQDFKRLLSHRLSFAHDILSASLTATAAFQHYPLISLLMVELLVPTVLQLRIQSASLPRPADRDFLTKIM